ncbi:phosphatidylcholine and lysophosphatidylcholine phospholipase [Coemansia sp. RSA 989]|nr:phosphatidylcholine and lysophosphatidylcholine phospholipase [Coemansia sp. RSA 989]
MPAAHPTYKYRHESESEGKPIDLGSCSNIDEVKDKLAETAGLGDAMFRIKIYYSDNVIYNEWDNAQDPFPIPGDHINGDIKASDRFDLHPDVTHNEDSEGSNYMASLEARGKDSSSPFGSVRQKMLANAGFPADFLSMFMKSISIFGYIEEPVFHEFSRQLQTRRLLAGEQMFDSEDDRDDLNFYVVIDGQVEIFLADSSIKASLSDQSVAEWSPVVDHESGADSSDEEELETNCASVAQESAILLNTVGPGEVLSSLFSILSLFTEDVPLIPNHHHRPDPDAGTFALAPFEFGNNLELQTADIATIPSDSHTERLGQANEPRPLRPNVIARATSDTTLAMIPASAFQRVTRLYPKAAAHILQVILTRLQRVTFATLYDYLDLPDELVTIERAISNMARCPLRAEITGSQTMQQIKGLYAFSSVVPQGTTTMQSPVLGTHCKPAFTSRVSPAAKLSPEYTNGPGRRLLASWKITRANLEALDGRALSGIATSHMQPDSGGHEHSLNMAITRPSRQGSLQQRRRHRRAGSDVVPLSALPSESDIDQLRRKAFQQLCDSLGINPFSSDGRYTPVSPTSAHARDTTPPPTSTSSSSLYGSRRSSLHRKLPRTEHLLPLLQSINSSKRTSSSTPLAHIPSLMDELELYHLPDGFSLIEQGQRPLGLFIILDGKVAITHRDSVSDFTGVDRDGERLSAAGSTSEITRQMSQIAVKVKEQFERQRSAAKLGPQKHLQQAGPGLPSTQPQTSKTYYARTGDIVGYLPALTDMASLYTARSKGHVIAGFISHWALEQIIERYPIILMTLARRLTSRLPPTLLNIDYALDWVQVKASQMVYRQGESSDAVFVVLSGRLRAFLEMPEGGVSILAEYGQSQSVGEPNLLLNEPCKYNLHAIRDTELVRIPRALFRALMRSAPPLTFHLSQTLAVRTAQSLQLQHQFNVELQMQSHHASPGKIAGLEAGLRSHNRNLKSIALIPIDARVPIHAFAEQLEAALSSIAGRVALLDHTAMSRVLGRHAFSRIARLKIVSWIAELEQSCRLLLHVADGGVGSAWTRHCVRHSDFVLLVGVASSDPRVGEYERLLLALKTTARKELVLLHESRACTTGATREWLKRRPWVHAHHHIQMPMRDYGGFDLDGSAEAPESGSRMSMVLAEARSLLSQSIVQPSQRILPGLANSGLHRIRTSLGKYYRRLTHSKQLTPATYRGHRSDFARLARYLCGRSVGVVLSGGGARGIALLGVLQAFEEAGIPVDMVGGTSIGAFISGLYARNPDSVAIYGPLKAFSRRMSSMWRFLLDITYPILAYTSGREFNRAIWKVFKDSEIEDLWLPFYCMTANITQSRSEVHTTGLLWRVVRASMSLGGFVPPLCDENGDLLVDGGYLDNLPVQVMKNELGAHMIFAIDIAGENDTSPVRYGASVSGFWVLLNHLNPFRSYWIPTLSEVQSRLTYASSDRELENAKVADSCVYLRVPPRDVGVLDFGRFDELYRRGYGYARKWTSAWQQAGLLEQWQADGMKQTAKDPIANRASVPVGAQLARRNSI